MDTAFGAGNWTKTNAFSLAGITGASFAHSWTAATTTPSQIQHLPDRQPGRPESRVSAGGHLSLNAAPSEGSNIDFGLVASPDLRQHLQRKLPR